MSRLDRRNFLSRTTIAATTALVGGIAVPAVRAIEPIARGDSSTAGPKFKFSLAAYSYRDLLKGPQPQLSLEDFIRDCAKFGLEGTELTSYYFPTTTNPESLRQIKALCFRLGLDVSGTAVGNNMCHPAGPARDKELALVKRWVDYAEILGAPVIRIFSGNALAGQDRAEGHRLAVEGMEECCDYAGQHGVFLALENHGGLTASVDEMLTLIRDVKSPWFGVNVDTGNFHSANPYADLAKIAPYALNVQVKVVMSQTGGPKQPADMKRLAKIMSEAGYRGYIVLEYEESEDPRVACPRYLDEMRKAFG